MDLRVDVRVYSNQDPCSFSNLLCGRRNVAKVEFTVAIYQNPLLNRKPKLCWQFPISIEDGPVIEANARLLDFFLEAS